MDGNIFLVGPRACGKTTLGLALARALGLPFSDADALFVQRTGRSISDFVAERGWDAFRDVEADILRATLRGGAQVVGCGGGVVLRPENREVLAKGLTLYLKASPEVLAARLLADPAEAQRPSLTGRPLAEEVAAVLAERAPLYEACARAVIDASATLEQMLGQARAACAKEAP